MNEEWRKLQLTNPRFEEAVEIGQTLMAVERSWTQAFLQDRKLRPPVMAAIMMIGFGTYMTIYEKQPEEEEWYELTTAMIYLWKFGLFVPSEEFPYTFEEVEAEIARYDHEEEPTYGITPSANITFIRPIRQVD
jgi:hypothetical protein